VTRSASWERLAVPSATPAYLAGWTRNRVVWVANRGLEWLANRALLQRGGGHYVVAEKLRNASGEANTALSRPGR